MLKLGRAPAGNEQDRVTPAAPPPIAVVADTLEQAGAGGAKTKTPPRSPLSPRAPATSVWPSSASAALFPNEPGLVSPTAFSLVPVDVQFVPDRVKTKTAPA